MNRNIQLELTREIIFLANQMLIKALASFGSELDDKDVDILNDIIRSSEKLTKRLRKKIFDEFDY